MKLTLRLISIPFIFCGLLSFSCTSEPTEGPNEQLIDDQEISERRIDLLNEMWKTKDAIDRKNLRQVQTYRDSLFDRFQDELSLSNQVDERQSWNKVIRLDGIERLGADSLVLYFVDKQLIKASATYYDCQGSFSIVRYIHNGQLYLSRFDNVEFYNGQKNMDSTYLFIHLNQAVGLYHPNMTETPLNEEIIGISKAHFKDLEIIEQIADSVLDAE